MAICPFTGLFLVAIYKQEHLLNERVARASWFTTWKAANLQMHHRLPISDRQVGNLALVTAVERVRPARARRTGCADVARRTNMCTISP
jgi:hypothetical protein